MFTLLFYQLEIMISFVEILNILQEKLVIRAKKNKMLAAINYSINEQSLLFGASQSWWENFHKCNNFHQSNKSFD